MEIQPIDWGVVGQDPPGGVGENTGEPGRLECAREHWGAPAGQIFVLRSVPIRAAISPESGTSPDKIGGIGRGVNPV